MNETRLFFVVDSIEDNKEIFETLQEAETYRATLLLRREKDRIGESNEPRVCICLVHNAYVDDGVWTYEDKTNTFEIVKNMDLMEINYFSNRDLPPLNKEIKKDGKRWRVLNNSVENIATYKRIL